LEKILKIILLTNVLVLYLYVESKEISEEIIKTFGNRLRMRVMGICEQDQKILLVEHHSLGDASCFWAPPGGGIQFGERASVGLQREFQEETGLEIEVGAFCFVNEFLAAPLHAIELFFQVKICGGMLQKGFDPEMPEDKQIIKQIAFWDINDIKKENPLHLHSVFRNIEQISDIYQRKGYYTAEN
jgi:8-oxo-dGTP diphosphatase